MQLVKCCFFFFLVMLTHYSSGQSLPAFEEVNTRSYSLYEKGEWKELLRYGKSAIASGQDFILLRLRLGYAAFMTGNYTSAIQQYKAVLKNDSYNATARYYLWLCYRYLNQQEQADLQVKYLSKEVMDANKLKPFAITGAGVESSYKISGNSLRGNALYGRADVVHRLGWKLSMQHSVAFYNQTISEPSFTAVRNNNNININQKEYYNRLTFAINNNLVLIGAYHYLYTPFNNYSYNNHVGLFGIKYLGGYIDLQANAITSRLTDSIGNQFEFKVGLHPLGNLNLYSYSTGIYSKRKTSQYNFKQVVGFKVLPKTWIEFNATFGKFRNLLENDALYVFNSIDMNNYKAGGTLYYTLGQRLLVSAMYTYEERQLFKRSQTFNQYSITGGLLWKM